MRIPISYMKMKSGTRVWYMISMAYGDILCDLPNMMRTKTYDNGVEVIDTRMRIPMNKDMIEFDTHEDKWYIVKEHSKGVCV